MEESCGERRVGAVAGARPLMPATDFWPSFGIWFADLWLVATVAAVFVVAVDLAAQRNQEMWIMYVVWPLTALWAGPLGAVAYIKIGRPPSESRGPVARQAVATAHCGSGCTLGDLVAEGVVAMLPLTLFGHPVLGLWALGLAFAFLFGIAFQYWTIAPMRNLGVGDGLLAAVRADALSLAAWQVGMYGVMGVAQFWIFAPSGLSRDGAAYWVVMQLAMLVGFGLSYPVNGWLIRRGWKEEM